MKRILFILLLSVSFAQGLKAQRMLVLPDTPLFANQNRGVWVFRIADGLPYYSNGSRWIANTGGLGPQAIRDSLIAYDSRNVTSYNGIRGPVKGVDSIWFTNLGTVLNWRFNNITYSQSVSGGSGVPDSTIFPTINFVTSNFATLLSLNTKVNISDTSTMLLPYLLKSDTTGKWVSSAIVRNDSVFFIKNGSENFLFKITAPATSWGTITGTLASQTDLQAALNGKQETLVSGTNLKTVNGNSLLGAGDIPIAGGSGEDSVKVGEAIRHNSGKEYNKFVVRGSCIMRPGTPVGGIIPWSLLNDADHQPVFFDSIWEGRVYFPKVKKIHHVNINTDESLAASGIFVGPSVNLDNFLVTVGRYNTAGGYIVGNGTTVLRQGNLSSWTINYTSSTGVFGVAAPAAVQNAYGTGPYKTTVYTYMGARNARVVLTHPDGAGADWQRFVLRDNVTDTVITGSLLSTDIIGVATGFASFGGPTINVNNTVFNNSANFWVSGEFEAWIVAAPYSKTTMLIDWQAFPSATSYKIYRSTSKNGTYSLIYSGSNLQYTDTGLSPNTRYFYRMFAVVSGVDTFVSYYSSSTAQ